MQGGEYYLLVKNSVTHKYAAAFIVMAQIPMQKLTKVPRP